MDVFQIWLPKVENTSKYLLKILCANGKREFISIKLRIFGKKRGIAVKYVTPYLYMENGLVKRR